MILIPSLTLLPGTWGLSEASAESVASAAKFVSRPNDSTAAIIQKVLLRYAGFVGDGSDDLLIHRCWAEYFGSTHKVKFTLKRRSKGLAQAREASGGSKTLGKVMKATLKVKKRLIPFGRTFMGQRSK